MENIKKDVNLYLLTGLFQRCKENSLELLETMISDVKKDQLSTRPDDPEKENIDKILNESLKLLETVAIYITNNNKCE